jgi:hypothetical protein
MWGRLLERSLPHAPFKNFQKGKYILKFTEKVRGKLPFGSFP